MMLALLLVGSPWIKGHAQEPERTRDLSFKNDVFPIIRRACLPCHAEENFNPSNLSLDSFDLLRQGGKHGVAVVPGNTSEGSLLQKLLPNPPFGERMPLDPKKKKGQPSTRKLSEREIQLIIDWVKQGAKDN